MTSEEEARHIDNRRWKIGIGISLIFGIFGAVMAILTYSERSDVRPPSSPAAIPASAPEHGHGRGRTKER